MARSLVRQSISHVLPSWTSLCVHFIAAATPYTETTTVFRDGFLQWHLGFIRASLACSHVVVSAMQNRKSKSHPRPKPSMKIMITILSLLGSAPRLLVALCTCLQTCGHFEQSFW